MYREQNFPPTATDWERIFWINLEGGFFSPSALMELVIPLGQAVRTGVYGPAALVFVSSDEGTREFLEALAQKHELPIFLSWSPVAPLTEAQPIGALTVAEMDTYGLIRSAGGEVTSSRVAELAGIEINAAVNRLSGLARKGYLHRVSRSRREGDAFVDLLSVEVKTSTEHEISTTVALASEEFNIPEEFCESVRAIATAEGSNPAEVLLRAWREFLERHEEDINIGSREVSRLLKENDYDGLVLYLNRGNRQRAIKAATRHKGKSHQTK